MITPDAMPAKAAAEFVGISERRLKTLERAGLIKRLPCLGSYAVADLRALVEKARTGQISDAKESATHDDQVPIEEEPLGDQSVHKRAAKELLRQNLGTGRGQSKGRTRTPARRR